jgi:hypothetical protein
MLSKCAEMRVLRRAFPDDLGGIYSDEEMDQASNPTSLPDAAEEVASSPRSPVKRTNPSPDQQFPEPGRTDHSDGQASTPSAGTSIANEVFADAIDEDIAEEIVSEEQDDLDTLVASVIPGRIVGKVISEAQRKHLFATIDKYGLNYDDLKPKILEAYNIDSIKELPADKLDSLNRRLLATAGIV